MPVILPFPHALCRRLCVVHIQQPQSSGGPHPLHLPPMAAERRSSPAKTTRAPPIWPQDTSQVGTVDWEQICPTRMLPSVSGAMWADYAQACLSARLYLYTLCSKSWRHAGFADRTMIGDAILVRQCGASINQVSGQTKPIDHQVGQADDPGGWYAEGRICLHSSPYAKRCYRMFVPLASQ
jgi:hypothetical protein